MRASRVVWLGRFTTINISKYEHLTPKISETYSHLVSPLWFLTISAVLSLFCHYCYSCQKTKSHFHFDLCPRGDGLRPENPPDRHFSQL